MAAGIMSDWMEFDQNGEHIEWPGFRFNNGVLECHVLVYRRDGTCTPEWRPVPEKESE